MVQRGIPRAVSQSRAAPCRGNDVQVGRAALEQEARPSACRPDTRQERPYQPIILFTLPGRDGKTNRLDGNAGNARKLSIAG
jgi:hypothetical protein